MTSIIPFNTIKLIGETVWRVLFFPLWWYSYGLVAVWRVASQSIKNQYLNLGLGVWLANLFVPMYGTTDLGGRVISFFIRLFMIIVRGFLLILWIFLVLIFLAVYLLLLPITVFGFIFHFFF